jgi:phosphoribosylformylglycinamidine cyclo-ligase
VIAALIDAGEQASVIGEIIAGQKGCEIHGAPGQWGEAAAWTASHDA